MDPAKIKAIRRYLSFHDVKYYDVQAELIDHFATAIEKIEKENPGIRFKTALVKAHRDFGGNAAFEKYNRLVYSRVRDKTWKLVGKTMLSFLSWPYFLVTAVIFITWALLIKNEWVSTQYLGYFSIFMAGFFLVFVWNEIYLRKSKWYLPIKGNRSLGGVFGIAFYLPSLGLNYLHVNVISIYAGYYTFLTILAICIVMVPKIMTHKVEEMYSPA